jgi:hypothetical protein
MKSIAKHLRTPFAKSQDESRQVVCARINRDWKFGVLNGEVVMYNPSQIRKVKGGYETLKEFGINLDSS